MIEVERKFILTKENVDSLTKNAEFLREVVFTDTYYDTPDYKLTTKDIWLRARNGKFELKVPLHKNTERIAEQYKELETEDEIRKELKLPGKDFAEDLQKSGYLEFCTCKTIRKKYKNEQFTIDLDQVEFENQVYHIGEIELMVEKEADMEQALKQIAEFARKQKLTLAPVRGKVLEYLRLFKPKHYEALITAGVVQEILR